MTLRSIESSYAYLKPEERFRLIMAARGRDDEVERERLARSGRRIMLSMQDHAPYTNAFKELALHVYIELLDHVARFEFAIASVRLRRATMPDDRDDPAETMAEEDPSECPAECLQAAGYIVHTYANGWRLFCENRAIPPFVSWENLSGYERIQTRLSQAEKVAYSSEEFVAWLNSVKPEDDPELHTNPYTAEGIAQQLDEAFAFVARWSGGGA
jgi:hypothetical protein